MVVHRTVALVVCIFAAGCSSLLPRAESATQESWKSFDEAKAAIERLAPGKTTLGQLVGAGLDPYRNASVTILSFSDIAQRFALGSVVDGSSLDAGIRTCLAAGKRCTGLAIVVRQTTRRRVGNFWLDIFNFYRDVDVTGWSFNALVLMVDDVVVYTLTGGQPRIHDREVSRNPLGPFQGAGETLLRERAL